MENILSKIEEIRKEKGIKQVVIAELLGIKQPAYSNFINRNSDISLKKLSQICNILKISEVDILTYPDKYLPETEIYRICKDKDETIANLNEYINFLKTRRECRTA